jgi:diamine N-acetyltransferase
MYSMLAGEWPAAKEKLEARLLAQATGTTSSHKKVELTQVTEEMVRPLLRLTPGAIGERMVATNAVSLAQAAYSANAVPHAIVVDDVPVGFIMLYDPTIDAALAAKHGEPADAVQLWRLMIDFQRQGRGYGEAAILEAVRYAATRPGVTQMRLSYVPMEGNASPFYRSLGFVETGEKDGDEIVMAQPLSALVARLNANG